MRKLGNLCPEAFLHVLALPCQTGVSMLKLMAGGRRDEKSVVSQMMINPLKKMLTRVKEWDTGADASGRLAGKPAGVAEWRP